MTWFDDSKRNWTENFAINVLNAGQISKHVGFIMDGNRRFAKKMQAKATEKQVAGFHTLTQASQTPLIIKSQLDLMMK